MVCVCVYHIFVILGLSVMDDFEDLVAYLHFIFIILGSHDDLCATRGRRLHLVYVRIIMEEMLFNIYNVKHHHFCYSVGGQM